MNAQQLARTMKCEIDQFEAACKGSLTPDEAGFTYGYDAFRGFYIKASEPVIGFEEFFDIGGHPRLQEILDSIAFCPGLL